MKYFAISCLAFVVTVALISAYNAGSLEPLGERQQTLHAELLCVPAMRTRSTLKVVNSSESPGTLVGFQTPCTCAEPDFTEVTVEPSTLMEIEVFFDTIRMFENYPTGGNFEIAPVFKNDQQETFLGVPIPLSFNFKESYKIDPYPIFLSGIYDSVSFSVTPTDFSGSTLVITGQPEWTDVRVARDDAQANWIISVKCAESPAVEHSNQIEFALLNDNVGLRTEGRVPIIFSQPIMPRISPVHTFISEPGNSRHEFIMSELGDFQFRGVETSFSEGLSIASAESTGFKVIIEFHAEDIEFGRCGFDINLTNDEGKSVKVSGVAVFVANRLP